MLFKNFKVKKTLIAVFAFMLAFTVVSSVVLIVMQNVERSNYKQLIAGPIQARQLIADTNAQINSGAASVRDAVLDPGQVSSINDEVDNILSQIKSNLDALEATNILDQSTMDSYRNTVEAWTAVVPQVLDLVTSNKVEEASSMLLEQCSPKLEELSTTTTNLTEELNTLVNTDEKQLSNTFTVISAIIVVIILLLVVFCVFLVYNVLRSLMVPLRQLRDAVQGFGNGNLSIPVEFESRSELGQMCEAMRKGQSMISGTIDDMGYLLEEMADGNFDVRSRDYSLYVGDLERVLEAVKNINFKLSDTLGQISLSAEQVAAGADQVSTGAQALAQGATEQASAVEQLSATITEISHNAQKNKENSEQAMTNSHAAGAQVEESAKAMDEMVSAMKRISDSSEEIRKIIGTIENIAFQTNILALNAAVEAARAGSAGKGFAVVADEVRNLASKSDQAAKATKDFIERSINSVQEGNEIVQSVSESLKKTIEMAEKAIQDMEHVANAVEEETDSIDQVTEGIDQISSVVQTNSATSEESAAASEELSSQASLMKDLLSKFKLRKTESASDQSVAVSASVSAPESHDDLFSNFSKY